MQKGNISIYSTILNQTLEIPFYGHYGFALVMFPALYDSAYSYEKHGTIDAIQEFISKGKCRAFVIPSFNEEIWFTDKYTDANKSQKFMDYNNFISDELVPAIYAHCNGPVPIITCGASIGGLLAANSYFRRPDCFLGMISLSGFFNLQYLSKDYYDDNCYFNSPEHYLPNLDDSFWLSYLLSRHHVYLYSGSGEDEYPHNTRNLSNILNNKGISNNCEIWGKEFGHNFETWNQMLVHILNTKL